MEKYHISVLDKMKKVDKMIEDWKKDPQSKIEVWRSEPKPVYNWSLVDVILEFNGPQLTVMDCPEGLHISMALETHKTITRWLRAPISEIELKMLFSGMITVRECFLKPSIWVVDEQADGTVTEQHKISPFCLNENNLPELDSFLPEEIITAHLLKMSKL